jgi:hypothetical protein
MPRLERRVKLKKQKAAPAINCAHDKLERTAKLRPNPRNPNKHPPAQRGLYARILHHQGWRKSIVVSSQSGFIVTGGRLPDRPGRRLGGGPGGLSKFQNAGG